MGYNIFLDDERTTSDDHLFYMNKVLRAFYQSESWIYIRNYEDFMKVVTSEGLPSLISFDCDLSEKQYEITGNHPNEPYVIERYEAEGEKTGLHCAIWMVGYCMDNDKDLPLWMIHSQNIPGLYEIQNILTKYDKFRKTNV